VADRMRPSSLRLGIEDGATRIKRTGEDEASNWFPSICGTSTEAIGTRPIRRA